ncbi:alginate lyase family protein [Dysgonomonas sp. HDW5B]|uniref:alginate lyase family protein n=1 Tax=Dysgonomonas sp. HDW5B TaxID=2714927 RepID=UPI001407E77B|nr:alginate lyase family protein [Dysgonomonas sp. HDW5B]QIK52981.1 alginate lyase family protein [Dysgonomonas sp. HDW5B]
MKVKYYIELLFVCVSSLAFLSCSNTIDWANKTEVILHHDILKNAEWAMSENPQTITDFRCDRSAGGIHDFYSEGDYWWPNSEDPDGPYIRKDGQTNPDNFVAHRLAMIRFNKIVGALASAYLVTGDEKYVKQAFVHINAWFTDSLTRMNPNLLYAQAIKGVTTGRGIGIIDTIHLMEVAQGIICMENAACVDKENLRAIKNWFSEYTNWMTTHENGIDEMNAQNNHGACWVMQLAAFAKLTEDKDKLDLCRIRYKNILLPQQMAEDGSFPQEIARTKPYGYSLFNLDVMTTICQILSTSDDNLWEYTTSEGVNMKKGIDFMYPYIKDKTSWTYPQDVMYWDNWPVAQPSLLFAAKAYNDETYFDLWKSLDHSPAVEEVERNLPVRNPLIWLK